MNIDILTGNELIESFNERFSQYSRPTEAKTTRSVAPSDHGKIVRCVAEHIALPQPLETSRRIEVYCEYNDHCRFVVHSKESLKENKSYFLSVKEMTF